MFCRHFVEEALGELSNRSTFGRSVARNHAVGVFRHSERLPHGSVYRRLGKLLGHRIRELHTLHAGKTDRLLNFRWSSNQALQHDVEDVCRPFESLVEPVWRQGLGNETPLEVFVPFYEKADDLLEEARIPTDTLQNSAGLRLGEARKAVL